MFLKYAQSLSPVSMDCSLPGSSVHGISQARLLEWVAISYSVLKYGYMVTYVYI